jgi:exopolysaccharide biosynthesis predicted pyruvyltransferase EpsI
VWLTRAGFGLANEVEKRRASAPPSRWFTRFSDGFALENLRRGIRLLSTGERLVTDRLHGHVLACLLDIPHVVVADRFGKVEALWRTWTHVFSNARFSPTWDGAGDALASLG